MNTAVLEALSAGGPVAILALIIFIMYVKTQKDHEDCLRRDRRFMEDRLTKIIDLDQASREKSTEVLTGLSKTISLLSDRIKKQ